MEVHSGKALASVSLMALYRALFRQRETQVEKDSDLDAALA